MQVKINETDPSIVILHADAELNEQTSSRVVDHIEELADRGVQRIIVDCTDLTHVSSFGLGVLIRVHHRIRKRGGMLVLADVKGMAFDALKMTHLDRIFQITESVDEALSKSFTDSTI